MVNMFEWRSTERHPLFDKPAVGLNMHHICLDILHVLDLGLVQHINGSILFLLVWDAGLFGTLDVRIDAVWAKLVSAYDSLGTPSGERVQHQTFANIFAGQRSYNPVRVVELHSKGAIARHCSVYKYVPFHV